MRHHLLAILAVLLPATMPAAVDHSAALVSVRVEYYSVEHPTLDALVTAPTTKTDASKLRQKIRKLVADGKASLVDGAYIVTRSGQRAKVESSLEWTYPSEYDPPETPQDLQGPVGSDDRVIAPTAGAAIETRNVGLSFEVDPVIGAGGKFIDLNLSPGLVTRTGEAVHGQDNSRATFPVFHTIRTSNAITLKAGSWAVLGVHRLPGSEPDATTHRVLTLVSADARWPGSKDSAARVLSMGEELAAYQEAAGEHTDDDPFGPPPAADSKPPEPPGWYRGYRQVSITVEWFRTGGAAATDLVDRYTASTHDDATALREALLARVRAGKATLIETARVTTRSGQRALSASASEMPMPNKLNPPSVPSKLVGPVDPGADITAAATLGRFEFRNVGPTLEVDPVIGHIPHVIDIHIAPYLVAYTGDHTIGIGEAAHEHPLFHSLTPSFFTRLHHGVPALAAMASPPPSDPHAANFGHPDRVLVILTARTIESN